jgi:hypothetical protein
MTDYNSMRLGPGLFEQSSFCSECFDNQDSSPEGPRDSLSAAGREVSPADVGDAEPLAGRTAAMATLPECRPQH